MFYDCSLPTPSPGKRVPFCGHKHGPRTQALASERSCRNSSLSSHGSQGPTCRKSLDTLVATHHWALMALMAQGSHGSHVALRGSIHSPSWGAWPWFHSSALWPTLHGHFCPGHVCVVCVWVCALKMLIDEMIPHIIMWVYVSNISIAHTPNHTSHTLPSQSPQCGLTTSTLMSCSCSSSSRSNRSTCHGRSSASAWHIRCASASASQGSTVSTVHTETSSVERSACSAAGQTKVEGDSAMQVAFYLTLGCRTKYRWKRIVRATRTLELRTTTKPVSRSMC